MALSDPGAIARLSRRAAMCAGVLLACAHAGPARADAADCSRLAAMAWLIGTWRAESRDTLITETWVAVSDITYEGRGITRSRTDGDIRDAEDLRLVAMGDGVFYLAKVAHNERPVTFRLTSCSDGTLVFENPAHDFPRRIEYRRVDDARFEAHVTDGGNRGFRLVFSRSPPG
jgi:hypothetical protein